MKSFLKHIVYISCVFAVFCLLSELTCSSVIAEIGFEASTRTVTDETGKQIMIEKPFKRIISLYGAHTENLFALGLDKEIIGVTRHEAYPEKAKQKPFFSYHDDPEKFMAANPDLILIRPMITRGYGPLIERLEKSGITVLSFQPNTIEEMYVYWQTLGALTGKIEQAENMVSKFKSASDSFKMLTTNVDNKKKVYFEAIHSKMKTFTPDSMAIFVLETAGGINIAHDAEQVRQTNISFYGKERLLSKAGDIDIYLAQNGTMNSPTIEMIKTEPGYHIIKAIKTNQIFLIDEMLVSRPTQRLLIGIYETGKILYPNIYDEQAKNILK